jgi:hypothetical protein
MSSMTLSQLRNLSLLLSVQVPLIAHSSVNMKDGNYSRTFTDGGILSRTYSSHSIHNGFFGYGWCSDLELRLEMVSESEIRLDQCGILSTFTRKRKSLYILGQRTIEKRRDHLILIAEGRSWTFESSGRLSGWRSKVAGDIALDFDADGRPLRMRSRRLGSWSIGFVQNKISKLETPHGRGVFYFYGGENLLRYVDSSLAPVSFSYDDTHNLINVAGPGGPNAVERVVYDVGRDLVLELQREDGCKESFQYERATAAQEIIETAIADIECRGLHSNVTHEFKYEIRPGGRTLLTRVKSSVNGELRGRREYVERGRASNSRVRPEANPSTNTQKGV